MNINSLRAFVRLAENGCDFSIHRELGMARSSLWTLIDELEKETGLELIVRRKRHNSFTEEAERFLPFAREMLNIFERGLEEASADFQGDPSGEILIATTVAISHSFLMPSIKTFKRLYPNIQVKVIADDHISSSTEWMADIIFRPIDTKEHLERKWHISSQSALYASEEYIERCGMPETTADLANHTVIGYGESLFSYFSDVDWHIKGRWAGSDIPRITPAITINSTMSIFMAAEEGIGICATTQHSNMFYSKKLVRVLPQVSGPTIKTHFCVKRCMGSKLRQNVEIFQDFFESHLRSIAVELIHDTEKDSGSVKKVAA